MDKNIKLKSTSWKMPGWMKHTLGSRLPGKISITSDMQITPSLWQRGTRIKEPLDESERGEWKSWLKTQHSKTKIMASIPIISWQIDGEILETVRNFNFGAPKSLQMVTAAMKLKDARSLEEKSMTNLDSILKSRDITLPTKVHLVKTMVFPVVMYGCESWTIKKAEHWRIDALNCGVGEDTWESLGQQGDQTCQS